MFSRTPYVIKDECYDCLFHIPEAKNPIFIKYNGKDHYNPILMT